MFEVFFADIRRTGSKKETATVNCVRREGEGGGNAWQERSLAAEGGKELKLHPRSLGLYSVDSRVKLDDLEGISIEGKGSLRIAAAGQMRIEGSEVDLQADAFHFYQGDLKVSRGGEASFSKKGELHLDGEGDPLVASVLAKSTALPGYEPEDYSGGQHRFRDDPLEESYDWAGLAVRVTACVAGMMVTDAIQGRVSGMEEYVRAALSGSIIGAMTGAAEQLLPEMGLLGDIGKDFVLGSAESALEQAWMDGEVDGVKMFRDGLLSVAVGAAVRGLSGGSGKVEGGRDAIQIGKTDLDALRNKLGVLETDTIAVGKTDVKGLEGVTFEGQSPKVRSEAGLPDLDEIWAGRNIKSPGNNPLFTRHAEEVLANDFDRAVIEAGINPQDVSGVLKIHQSNPTGVCRKCIQGLANDNVSPGVLKQLSLKYPNLRIEVTSEILPDVKVTGKSNFVIQNGQYVE